MERETNYHNAVHYLNNSLIMCNDIIKADESVLDNMRFDFYNEEDDSYMDIYQWFLTDCTKDEVEYLERSFGLLFTYSDKLDLYVLCVNHLGTRWDNVYCPCYNDDIQDEYL